MAIDIGRRQLIAGLGAVALPTAPRFAWAQGYPARPAHLIISVAPGGSPDIIGRLMAQWLSERLGQPFVVDNRAGAAGNIGSEFALKAPPDGYTLLLALSANAINASLYSDLHFNFIRDAVPVASIGTIPLIMEVNPSVPANTVPEFIAYAKANPGKINMASGGVGSPLHVAGELFKMMAGVDLVHVPYRSEALALPDLLGGQVQVLFGVMPASLGYVRAGKLRALGVTTAKRQELLPDVPAVAEFLPGFEASGWYGIVAPGGTPTEIVDTLNQAVNAGLADPTMKQRFVDLGCAVFAGTPADFEKFIVAETEKWARVIKFAGIKPG
jgi:tripartite-type tricarboxylate transporter receptor subunit TctC